MLDSAPGADLLNEWANALADGMTLEDMANRIASSDAFQSRFAPFLTDREFAEAFIDDLMGGEIVSATLMAAAVAVVAGLLDDGMTRGALALAAVEAMQDIHARGQNHPAFGDFGVVASGLANKIEVAVYYTVELRQPDPSSRILRDINSDIGLDDIRNDIEDLLDPSEPVFLTRSRDVIEGTAANERFIAEPDAGGADTLNEFDVLDGGAGYDVLEIYQGNAEQDGSIDIGANHAVVNNVERVYLSALTGIAVDLTAWKGVEEVELGRFGADSDVSAKVDGAAVRSARTFGGDVTIDGAAGALRLTTTIGEEGITVITRGHTTSVTVDAEEDIITIDGDGMGTPSASLERVTANKFASLTISSDALEIVSLTESEGAVTVHSEALESLQLELDEYGDGATTLVTLNATEDIEIETLTLNLASESSFALMSSVVNLTVTGAADLDLLFDAFVDIEGDWEFIGPDGVCDAGRGKMGDAG